MLDGNLKLIIADDESHARSRLRSMVEDIGGWAVVAEVGDGEELLRHAAELQPDVVLLDIRMPQMDGMEAARHLSSLETPPAIVFTTAYDEYAVNAFDAQAVGYLLKPVRLERLKRSLARAARLSRMQLEELARNNPESRGRSKISVVAADGVRLIPIENVISFHADQKYVRMIHDGGEELIDESLKALEHEYRHNFIRVHRNSLVRIASIDALSKDEDGHYIVRLAGVEADIPVSRRLAPELKERLS